MDSFRASEQVSPERKRDKAREMGTRFKTFPRGGSRPKGGESEGGGGGERVLGRETLIVSRVKLSRWGARHPPLAARCLTCSLFSIGAGGSPHALEAEPRGRAGVRPCSNQLRFFLNST